MSEYDVIVVGGGPAGCRTAELVSRKGYKVLLVEEHKSIGEPVHCTGLISGRLKEILPDLPDSVIINSLKSAKFFHGSNSFELISKNPVYVVDRARLDRYLYTRMKSNADVKLDTKFVDFKRDGGMIKVKTTKGIFETKLLVGADGHGSRVASKAGLEPPENRLVGVQATVNGHFDSSAELWFGKDLSPDFFGWVVPLDSSEARVGLAAKSDAKDYFDKFLESRLGKTQKPDAAGIINFGLMDTAADNVLLVGDAACQVKPLSGGGVIYSLICAGFCANACIKSLREKRFDKAFLEDEYDKEWKEKLQKPIERGIFYSKLLHSSEFKVGMLFRIAKMSRFLLQRLDMDLL
jgi:geranylgeranyl reductase family protein